MILITGGAYQGKTSYIQSKCAELQFVDGAECTWDELLYAECIMHYHKFIRRMMNTEKAPEILTEILCDKNPNCIILLDEIGSGIIPMDQSEREWRESTGRCGCILAAHADTVIRLVCGIPYALKGELL